MQAAIAEELHRSARRIYPRRRVIVKGIDNLHQIDLIELIAYHKYNSGYKYGLTVIDVYSKYAWFAPLKTKSGDEVTNALRKIYMRDGRIPKNLQSDLGKEFYNSTFSKLMRKYKINHYSTYSTMKASVVERFNRTLKGMLFKHFTAVGSYKWIDIIQDLVSQYNNRKHRTIQMKPADVVDNSLLSTVYSKLKMVDPHKSKFKIGDFVRISKHKSVFEKGFTANWSTEIFKIIDIRNTNPRTYILEDYRRQPVAGGFYAAELQKTNFPTTFLVEKVLRKKGNRAYVKWLGFSNTHNSWISR